MSNPSAPKPGCLIMAAGNASRFGENKLFAPFRGRPLLELALLAVPQALFSRVTVVSQYDRALALARDFGFEAVLNPAPELGVSRTICLGTAAMKTCDAILYMVADQPLLTSNSVHAVVSRWQEEPGCIVGAAHHGRCGNPCIFPKEFFPELMQLSGDCGGKRVIRQHEDKLRLVEIPAQELFDCDTQEALETLDALTSKSSFRAF